MKQPLTQSMGDAFKRAAIPQKLDSLIVSARSRGMRVLDDEPVMQKREEKRHKKHEGHRGQSRKVTEMNNETTTESHLNVNTSTRAPAPVPQAELAAIGQLGEQLGALFGSKKTMNEIAWRAVGQEVITFSAKAAIATVCTVGVLALAKHWSSDTKVIETEG